jgi:hypothetical protein
MLLAPNIIIVVPRLTPDCLTPDRKMSQKRLRLGMNLEQSRMSVCHQLSLDLRFTVERIDIRPRLIQIIWAGLKLMNGWRMVDCRNEK